MTNLCLAWTTSRIQQVLSQEKKSHAGAFSEHQLPGNLHIRDRAVSRSIAGTGQRVTLGNYLGGDEAKQPVRCHYDPWGVAHHLSSGSMNPLSHCPPRSVLPP
jgi:hypothetical protein